MSLLGNLQVLLDEGVELVKRLARPLTRSLGLKLVPNEVTAYEDTYWLTTHQGARLIKITFSGNKVWVVVPDVAKLPSSLKSAQESYVGDFYIGTPSEGATIPAYDIRVTPENVDQVVKWISRIGGKLEQKLAKVVSSSRNANKFFDKLLKEAKKQGFQVDGSNLRYNQVLVLKIEQGTGKLLDSSSSKLHSISFYIAKDKKPPVKSCVPDIESIRGTVRELCIIYAEDLENSITDIKKFLEYLKYVVTSAFKSGG